MKTVPNPMNEEQFWSLIEDANGDAALLKPRLMLLSKEDIVAFHLRLDNVLYQLDRRDIHAVTGGSDDGFEYVRLWIVSRGHEYTASVLREPEHAPHEADDDEENEDLGYAAVAAYEEQYGEHFPDNPWRRASRSNTAGWAEQS